MNKKTSDLEFAKFRAALFSDDSLLSFGENEKGERVCYGVSIEKLAARLAAEVTERLLAMADQEKDFIKLCLPEILSDEPLLISSCKEVFIEKASGLVSCVDATKQLLKQLRSFVRDGLIDDLEIEDWDGKNVASFCWTEVGAEALHLVHSGQV